MAQAKPQFTAEQILEAGRRAEAQGQLDYAIQFYRHLTDHHPNAPEAQAAREALARLGPARAAGGPEGKAPVTAPAGAQPSATVRPYRNGASQPLGAATTPEGPTLGTGPGGGVPGHSPAPAPAPAMSRIDLRLAPPPEARPDARFDLRREAGPRPPPPAPAQAPLPAHPAPHVQASAAAFHPVELPRPVRGYRISRFFAGVVTVMGLLQLVAGVGLTGLWVAAMLRLAGADQMPGFLIAAGPYSIGLVFTGAVTIVMGQALKAIFDTANASRELIAIARTVASGGRDEH